MSDHPVSSRPVADAARITPYDSVRHPVYIVLLFFVYYLYDNAFQNFRMGYASALAWILFVVILVLTAVTLRGSAFAVYYETELSRKRRRR